MKYIVGAKIITETEILEDHVLGFDERFARIIPRENFNAGGAGTIDAGGLYLAPGLIDVHIHGSGGKDAMEGTEEALETVSASIARNGVTSFLATTMTMGRDRIIRSFESIRSCMGKEMPGARLLGAHMEGPFISMQFKGAQNPDFVISPDWKFVDEYKDVVKIVTLAPELPGSQEFTARAKECGIVVSMGHSAASYEEAVKGIDAGVSHCTHLFNAMTGVHHRNPGVAAAALSSGVYCEMIADGIHVHPGLFELVKRAKGMDRIVLITDCTEAGGMPDGEYSLGGQPIIVKNGAARLQDGTLAGSVLKLNRALYNFYKNTDCSLPEVFRTATVNPAAELGIEDMKGSVAEGKDADFFLMDGEFNVKATYVGGRCVYGI